MKGDGGRPDSDAVCPHGREASKRAGRLMLVQDNGQDQRGVVVRTVLTDYRTGRIRRRAAAFAACAGSTGFVLVRAETQASCWEPAISRERGGDAEHRKIASGVSRKATLPTVSRSTSITPQCKKMSETQSSAFNSKCNDLHGKSVFCRLPPPLNTCAAAVWSLVLLA